MSISKQTEMFLVPSWLGKIDWGHGLPTSHENYNSAKAKTIDYWGKYKSPVWCEIYEYRKIFPTVNHNTFNYYEHFYNLQDKSKEKQFITFSSARNKKLNKQLKFPFSQYNEYDYSMNDDYSMHDDSKNTPEDIVLDYDNNDIDNDIICNNTNNDYDIEDNI